jgi:putative oxidoreductase
MVRKLVRPQLVLLSISEQPNFNMDKLLKLLAIPLKGLRYLGYFSESLQQVPGSISRRRYELLVAGANLLQSPLLLALRLYFFWQLFLSGNGKLSNIGKVSEFFASLGIPLPTLNAYLVGSLECFGSVFLIIGLASRAVSLPIVISMTVAYLTADLEAVQSMFSDPDKFVKADPFPFLLSALIVLVFGPGRFSVDALIKRRVGRDDGAYQRWSVTDPASDG